MPLSSLQLEAFLQVAKAGNFSAAAKGLHLTQSALSQRILNLEDELQVALFVREPNGTRLTETGQELLQYCKTKSDLEEQFLGRLQKGDPSTLSGMVHIAGFSTYIRSILLPKLGEFGRKYKSVHFEIQTAQIRDLPSLLRSGRVDYIYGTRALDSLTSTYENHSVGSEENVLIQSRHHPPRSEIMIDHNEFDTTTYDFWRRQSRKPPVYRRIYFDEIYAVLDAVAQGLGEAVVPLHLAREHRDVKIVPNLKSLQIPVFLTYLKSTYYTDLQVKMIDLLKT